MIIGPMFSGKSTEIIRRIRLLKHINKRVLVVKPQIDDRYISDKITSHNYETADCIVISSLEELDINDYDCIIIDEGQFFNDLKENVINWVDNLNKDVVIGGLDGDFKRQPIGQILELIPYSDKCIKLNSLCNICKDGTEALFSHRIVNSKDSIFVGGAESYIPVCRNCFLSFNKID